MGDGFKDRLDKVFGSISSSSSWSLTDAQLQRREWKHRDDDNDDYCKRDYDQIPVFSSFNADHHIRSSIGLDPTLDREEEEDSYDKMAQGQDNCGRDRLYMKDVTPRGLYMNAHNHVNKDPRANHDAAKTRLKEDDDECSDEPMLNAEDAVVRIKSILKRKSYDEATKPVKRVRFDSTCKTVDAARPQGLNLPQVSGNRPSVPDYILNPSKYTQYTFDDCSCDGSDTEAYLELLEQVKKSSTHGGGVEQKPCTELPKSVLFIPRKKRGDAACNSEEQVKQSSTQACLTVGIAAVEVQQGEFTELQEEDDTVCTKVKSQKPVRQYRSKAEEYDDVT